MCQKTHVKIRLLLGKISPGRFASQKKSIKACFFARCGKVLPTRKGCAKAKVADHASASTFSIT